MAHLLPRGLHEEETSVYILRILADTQGIRVKDYKMIPSMVFTILNISTFLLKKVEIDFELSMEFL